MLLSQEELLYEAEFHCAEAEHTNNDVKAETAQPFAERFMIFHNGNRGMGREGRIHGKVSGMEKGRNPE